MNKDAVNFLNALAFFMADDERVILCGVPGDPGAAPPTAWKPRPWRRGYDGHEFSETWNGYVTVGSFVKGEDGTFRRRAGQTAAGLAFMVDDVGTKVPREIVDGLAPSAIIETSPGNEQWWYFFDKPVRDIPAFDAFIKAFIDDKLDGNDPGMASVTRVGRLPGYFNGKPVYGGFTTRLVHLDAEKRFTLEELTAHFGLTIKGRVERRDRLIASDVEDRIKTFYQVYTFLRLRGQLKRDEPDRSGWTEMHCPWVHEHTGAIDNGAGLREPAEENGYFGAFVCHHGSHMNHTWRDLTEWVNELAAESLDDANDRHA